MSQKDLGLTTLPWEESVKASLFLSGQIEKPVNKCFYICRFLARLLFFVVVGIPFF